MKNTPLLTPREKEILELSLGGAGCKQIAFQLGTVRIRSKNTEAGFWKKAASAIWSGWQSCRRKKINCLNSFP